MGDPTGGAASAATSAAGGGGGKSGGGAGDPSIDPSTGMGGTDPSMGSAMGSVDTAAPGVDPGIASLFGQAGGGGGYDPTGSATAQQQIGGAGNLGSPGQPPTDQPGGQQQAPQRYASLGQSDSARQAIPYQGLGPRTNLAALTATPGQPPTSVPDIAHAFAGSGPDAPGIHWDPIQGDPQYIRQGPSVTVSPEESQTGQHGVDAAPPGAPKYAPPATAEGTGGGDLTTDTKGNKIPGGTPITTGAVPPATPPATTPATAAAGGDGTAAGGDGTAAGGGGGTRTDPQGASGPATDAAGQQGQQAGMGRMPQSPLEQMIGQLLHPLEQMIMRALGINPNALFHAFQGDNPFNRQAGPGYYPPGTRGGRTVQSAGPPSLTPAPAQSQGQPQTPPHTPGTPGTPGNQPSATPPGRREGGFDPTLPGSPYTGETRDQPPPWYHENNPSAPEGTSSPSARQAGSGGANVTGVPDRVISLARQWATRGGPGAVFDFMRRENHPRSGAWCGEFAAAVMHSQGLPVPDHPETASNWRTWGEGTRAPKPGDIAVNKISYGGDTPRGREVPIGRGGSHVTTVTSVAPDGTVTLIGGNQSGFRPIIVPPNRFAGWDFRTMRSPVDQIRSIRYQPQMGM